jgi:hypothetical protein
MATSPPFEGGQFFVSPGDQFISSPDKCSGKVPNSAFMAMVG